jgi:transaldolase
MTSALPPLDRLNSEFGQSAWLDNLKRGYITSGRLAELRALGVRGLTSNPSIFQAAIQGSHDYDEQFDQLAVTGANATSAYWAAVQSDIDAACKIFRPVFDKSKGADGFVSVEVDPRHADDTHATVEQGCQLASVLDHPNVMIKIPATSAGIPAIQTMTAAGHNINVTLIFGIDRYTEVIEAYISGLEQLAARSSAELSSVSSVASFFISRVDNEVDNRLKEIATDQATGLLGSAAIAQAKVAYRIFTAAFAGPRWAELERRGARPQRPLWASTSTKNRDYLDTRYVDELIGANTVNTLPEATLAAFLDHGKLATSITNGVEKAERTLIELSDVGVDLTDVAETLEAAGVASFQASFASVLVTVEERLARSRTPNNGR